MSKPAAFTQSDIARVLKGAKAAGETVRRLEIDRGTGNIIAEFGQRGEDAASDDNEWMRAIRAKRERAAAKRH